MGPLPLGDCQDADFFLRAGDPAGKIGNNDPLIRRFPIAPQQTNIVVNGISLPESYLADMWTRGQRVYGYGALRYGDVFHALAAHITYYCAYIERDIDLAGKIEPYMVPCEHWNCTDEECAQDREGARDQAAEYAKAHGLKAPPPLEKLDQ